MMSPRETHLLANLPEHCWGQQLRKSGFDFPGHTGEGALSLGCGAARQLYLYCWVLPTLPKSPHRSELTVVFPGARVSLASVPRKPSLTFFLAPHSMSETVHGTEAVKAKPADAPLFMQLSGVERLGRHWESCACLPYCPCLTGCVP